MRLVLISLDAASRPDADRLFGLPALSALKGEGVFCKNVQTTYPTLTYPIHTSIITGCYPSRHFISHNQPFQPQKTPEMRTWHWRADEIKAKTLWQAAHERGLDVASVLWPVSGKNKAVRRNFPEILPLPGENATLKMLKYASPLWVMKMELLYGRTRKSILQPDLDDYAALLCEKLMMSTHPPDVLTVHFVDLDAMRHRYGADSREAHDAMKRLDKRVGRIVQTLKERALYEDTVVCIVSDHGQMDAPNAVLLNSILRREANAWAQTCGMGAFIHTRDIENTRAFLQKNSKRLRIANIYGRTELNAMHAAPDISLAVSAMDGCCFTDSSGETTKGEHGFSLDKEEAKCLLLLAGGPFKKGATLDTANIVDIAPTLASALGLSLPDTDGRALAEAFKKDGEESQ